jgi:hypothetical protein
MMNLEVINLKMIDDGGILVDSKLDNLEIGICQSGDNLYIQGWVLGQNYPIQKILAIHLIDHKNSGFLASALCGKKREDIAVKYPENPHAHTSGFQLFLSCVGLPEDIRICLRAIDENNNVTNFALITLKRHGKLESTYQARFQALMVTSLGRSGSTWLMHLLAYHPNVITLRQYPYENNVGKYILHNVFKSLAEPLNYTHSDNFNLPLQVNLEWAGSSLGMDTVFRSWAGGEYLEQITSFCQRSIDSFYSLAAAQQGQNPTPGVAYFAEKYSPNYYPHIFSEVYPHAREIILVRDFRDMLCSMHAFTQKRSVWSFGLKNVSQNDEVIEQVRLRAHSLLSYWQIKQNQVYLLRYEDLMHSPAEALKALFTYLELDADEALIAHIIKQASEDTPEMKSHRTSGKPGNSVGRWQRELPTAQQQQMNQVFDEVLRQFGYVVS